MTVARLCRTVLLLAVFYSPLSAGRELQETSRGTMFDGSTKGIRRSLAQQQEQEQEPLHPLQTGTAPTARVVPDQYIVVFKDGAGGTQNATERLVLHMREAAANRSTAAAASVTEEAGSVETAAVGDFALDFTPIGNTVGSDPQTTTNSQSPGVVGIVVRGVKPDSQLLSDIESAPNVEFVVPDLVVNASNQTGVDPSASCTQGIMLTRGVRSKSKDGSSLRWHAAECINGRTRARWIGERCGPSFGAIQYRAVYAMDENTGAVKTVRNQACAIFPTSGSSKFNDEHFGSCGQPPSLASDLPYQLCLGGSQAPCMPPRSQVKLRLNLQTAITCGTRKARSLTYYGKPCGPDRRYIEWNRATGPSNCAISKPKARTIMNSELRSAFDLFGACGLPPGLSFAPTLVSFCESGDASPSPSQVRPSPSPAPQSPPTSPPPPGDDRLPRVPLITGEEVPTGVSMIEGVDSQGRVPSLASVGSNRNVIVGVIDSGIDASHPDLEFIGGKSWVDGDPNFGTDMFGHGTHVAGIIGAKNNGQGVVGVSPGVKLYSLKVLDGLGQGMLSATLSAVKWVSSEGVKLGIKVINLSLVAEFQPTSANYEQLIAAVCKYYKEASDAGVFVAAAAGNYGADFKAYVPAFCPTVAAVTALDSSGTKPSQYSNWADPNNEEQKAHTFAAPGTSIKSTVPKVVDKSGYYTLSGTSMASPHVAGVAANCLMSGACGYSKPGADHITTLRDAAEQRFEQGNYANYNPTDTSSSRYHGYLIWAGAF